MIFRVEHRDKYTVTDNATPQDTRLSWKARGVLWYLLSMPDDWQVYETALANQSDKDGIRIVRAAIAELIGYGYIERRQKRNERNQFSGYEYIVYESPLLRFARTADVTLQSNYINKNIYNFPEAENGSGKHESISLNFYDWYVNKCYPHYMGQAHPRLKKEQRERVLKQIDSFIADNDIDDIEIFGDMVNNYFGKVTDCDYNINHFATEGIMTNCFYNVEYK